MEILMRTTSVTTFIAAVTAARRLATAPAPVRGVRAVRVVAAAVWLAIGMDASVAPAHEIGGSTDIMLRADAGDALTLGYDFEFSPIVSATDSGFAGLHLATTPGFGPGAEDAATATLELDLGTTLGLEILAIDPGLSWRFGATTLDAAQETVVLGTHDDNDPELSSLARRGDFQLLVDPSAERRFAERRVVFRVYDVDSGYDTSAAATLTVANGWLPTPVQADASSLKCTKSLAREDAKLFAAVQANLSRCLYAADSALVLGRSAAGAFSLCHPDADIPGSLAARNAAARSKARAKVEARCGELTAVSEPFTASAVDAHLDMVWCRAEEVAAAAWNNARDTIAQAIEMQAGASACMGTICIGGIADGRACNRNADCTTKTLVGAATACLHETAVAP
jgi:hypothetical protein